MKPKTIILAAALITATTLPAAAGGYLFLLATQTQFPTSIKTWNEPEIAISYDAEELANLLQLDVSAPESVWDDELGRYVYLTKPNAEKR